MTTYTPTTIPVWIRKPGVSGCPATVSFFGAAPHPASAYELRESPAMEVNAAGRITYSNYFFGRRLTTTEEFQAAAARLNQIRRRLRRIDTPPHPAVKPHTNNQQPTTNNQKKPQ